MDDAGAVATANRDSHETDVSPADRAEKLRRSLERTIGVPFTEGNSISALHNGVEIFPAMLDAIAGAERSILFATFIYWTGNIAQQFADALAERARAGVEVRVLLDGFGARPMPHDLLDTMREAGVLVRYFRPMKPWMPSRSAHRTHRKILVIDGCIGFTGGVGIAEEWEGDARDPSEWRDTHFRIAGPAVAGLTGGFIANWADVERPVTDLLEKSWSARPTGTATAQVVRASATFGWTDIALMHEMLITSARERLRIATAYFTPDEATTQALCDAAARGVEIEIMLPGPHTDKRVSELSGANSYDTLMACGVRIWEYQPTMFHTKAITVDGILSAIGSANFNQRSMRKDDELSLVMIDHDMTRQLDDDFDRDRDRCKLIQPRKWHERPLIHRLGEQLVRPLRNNV